MGPIKAIRSCLKKYFTWSGRASRSEFWWFLLFYLAGFIALVIIALFTGDEPAEADAGKALIFMLALAAPMLAVISRRLHDKGLSAWLMLLMFLPFGQIALLILAALRGDEGSNGYGEDPLGREAPEGLTYGRSRIPNVRDDG